MKKILSLLTAITLTASGTSGVISCGSSIKNNAASKKAVDAIKAKIVNKTLLIIGGNIKADASKTTNKPIIDAALKIKNSVLSPDDLKYITYSGTLTPRSTKTIKATITIGSGAQKASTTIDLSITWHETNQEAANSFATSLKNKNLSISFIQKNTDTKASAYKADIINQLKTQVPGDYDIAFATSADGEKNLLKLRDTSVNIKVTVNAESSTVIASINIKFSANSKVTEANNFATSLNGKSIAFAQQASKDKVSDYTNTIKTELQKEVTGNYDIKITQTEGNKTLNTSDIEVDVTITVGGVDSTRTAKIKMKFSDYSDIVKANNFANTLNTQSIEFMQKSTDTKASAYKADIESALTTKTPGNYTFIFDGSDGNIDLSTTNASIKIKIKVNGVTSTAVATINIKFSDNSDVVKANNIVIDLNNKSINFMQKGIDTKASAYVPDITTKLQEQVAGNYNFTFDGSDGNIDLTTTDKQIKIKIEVNGVSSTSSATINMKFSDNSDIAKANNFANQLNNLSVSFVQQGTNTKASDYTPEILSALKTQKAGNYTISFATPTEGDKTLSKTDISINIKAIVNSVTSTRIATINVKFTDNSDIVKANMIATTLKNATINPIKLNINNDKQKLSDYFQSDIKALLDAQLTDTEKAYNYSLVNNQNITNIAQDFNVKIQIGSATSTVEFIINVQFNYLKTNGTLSAKKILSIKKINNKFYAATDDGLWISNDATGSSFTKVSGDLGITGIYTIKQIGTGANTKIYIGTNGKGIWFSNDDGASFTQVSGDSRTRVILSIEKIGSKIYAGASDNLFVSNDGVSFSKIDSMQFAADIFSIKYINNKIYAGAYTGLYVSNDNGASFTQVSGILATEHIRTILEVGTGSSAKIYVGTLNGLYSSDLSGTNFTKVSGSLATKGIYTIKQIGSKIYVGTGSDGLWISNDAIGTSFTQLSGDLGKNSIHDIEQIQSKIYIATTNGFYYNFIS